MKKNAFFGLLVIVLAFGFIGCDDKTETPNGGEDAFAGTWLGTNGYSVPVKIIANDGHWKEWLNDNIEILRGTYTVSGNNVSMKYVEINTIIFDSGNSWVFFSQLNDANKANLGGNETIQFNISGGSITMLGATLTKQE